MTAGRSMPIKKTAEEKAGHRTDRTVFAERRNRLEKVKNDFQIKLLDRARARTKFQINKERKELAKNFQNVERTTGQSLMSIPSSLHDKDVISSEHYRCGLMISSRRLKQWRRQEEMLQKYVTKEEVKDEEELTDRQIVLNNLLEEIRRDFNGFTEVAQPRPRKVKELRMPYAAHPSTLDVFESLRREDERLDIERPQTAPVQRIRHRGPYTPVKPEVAVPPPKPKGYFNIPRWEKEVTQQYINSFTGAERPMGITTNLAAAAASRPQSARLPQQNTCPVYTGTDTCKDQQALKLSNDEEETPLFVRVNKHLSAERGILKIRPHSAPSAEEIPRKNRERPKSSPLATHEGRSVLKSNSTNTMATDHVDGSYSPSKSTVSFDLEPTIHDINADDYHSANNDTEDLVVSSEPQGSGAVILPDSSIIKEYEEVDESSRRITGVDSFQEMRSDERAPDENMVQREEVLSQERPSTSESDTSSTDAFRKVSFQDPPRPERKVDPRFIDDRRRKISSSSTSSGTSDVRESIDVLRKKHLLINLTTHGTINKRLTRTESHDHIDEGGRPSGPPKWRRELLRDAPPGLHSQTGSQKVYMTMSKSARKKELEKMVDSNTSNLRDMIISERERRAQTRINLQKSMVELDSINK